ncbi:MAG: DUF58 domain-containing protein [SAR202 cluster bacterium]|nr:DUF58 domain-containing protein [SAR202 cluster bacterium]
MKRLIVFGVLALLSFFYALATGFALYYRALYALVIAIAGAWLWARLSLYGLQVTVERQIRRATVGENIDERITVRNQTPLPKAWLEVRDLTAMRSNTSGMVISLGARGFRSWQAKLKAERRGVYLLGPVRVSSADPLGLFTLSRDFLEPEELVVYPRTVALQHLRLLATETIGEGSIRLRSPQVTPHAASIREYTPSDALSRIHWPSTARSGRLMVKDFDEGMGGGLWLLVDFHRAVQSGEGADATDEYAATVAASVAQRYLFTNLPVGLIVYGENRSLLPPERGEGQLRQVLEMLARSTAEGRVPLDGVLATEANRFDRATTVVIITPTTQTQWVPLAEELTRRRVRVVAIVLDGSTFSAAGSSTRVVEALAAAGILTYIVRKGDDLEQVLAFAHARTSTGDPFQPQASLV